MTSRGVRDKRSNFTTMQQERLYLWASALPECTGMEIWRHNARNTLESSLDEAVWKERVTNRSNELKHPEVATWERIQHQRQRFREWEPDTALFIDNLDSADQNYQKILDFVTAQEVKLRPLSEIPLSEGRYH